MERYGKVWQILQGTENKEILGKPERLVAIRNDPERYWKVLEDTGRYWKMRDARETQNDQDHSGPMLKNAERC